jgi:hypothetical protein
MEILIDKRIELITVVQIICNYWDNLAIKFTDKPLCQNRYKENVKEYFNKYNDHQVIKNYNTLCNDITDICAFLNLVLCYSNPPELESIVYYENNFGEFINILRQFYIDTDFETFYKNNHNEYQEILNNYGNKEGLFVNTVEEYLSCKLENFHIILSPLVMGNFGIELKTSRNEVMHYSIISPYDYIENNYIFGSKNFIKSVLWHEISHLTINNLTKIYIKQFDVNKKEIPEIFVSNLYTNIEAIINEYIIRAIVLRLFDINGEPKFMENLMKHEIQKGFINIETVKSFITENCENNEKLIKSDEYKELMKFVFSKI